MAYPQGLLSNLASPPTVRYPHFPLYLCLSLSIRPPARDSIPRSPLWRLDEQPSHPFFPPLRLSSTHSPSPISQLHFTSSKCYATRPSFFTPKPHSHRFANIQLSPTPHILFSKFFGRQSRGQNHQQLIVVTESRRRLED